VRHERSAFREQHFPPFPTRIAEMVKDTKESKTNENTKRVTAHSTHPTTAKPHAKPPITPLIGLKPLAAPEGGAAVLEACRLDDVALPLETTVLIVVVAAGVVPAETPTTAVDAVEATD
jgi:hypothetical protein